MSRGRKKIPAEMHILAGTFRADRHNADAPKPKEGIPPAPKHLDKVARAEYHRVARLLKKCRTITEADLAVLTCYASAWARLIEAEMQLKTTGLIVKSPAGFPCISPYLSIVRAASEELRKLAGELGLSPAARTKLKASPAATSNDPMAAIVGALNATPRTKAHA